MSQTPDSPASDFQLLRSHMPELDALRGVAVLSVVVYHGFYWLNHHVYSRAWQTRLVDATVAGWLGVNLFFILSGFLITGILLDTKSWPGYYREFYRRRALRIVPALAATLVLVVALRLTSLGGFALSVLFLVNYAPNLGVAVVYAPLWSLAVEEHFYLVWPALVRRFKISTIAWVCAGLCVFEPVLRYVSVKAHLGDPHQNTHLLADNLATGALLAIFARSRFATQTNSIGLGLALASAGPALFLAGIPLGILHRDTSFGVALQSVPFNLLFAGTLTLALALHSSFAESVWMRPLRYLGYISYGLYLYHLVVFYITARILAHLGRLQGSAFSTVVERFVVMLSLSILVACASRRWLEQPFLDWNKRIVE